MSLNMINWKINGKHTIYIFDFGNFIKTKLEIKI